jgi:hypothetical protein
LTALVLLLAAVVPGQNGNSKDAGNAKATTLCEIQAHPDDYLEREVDVDAVRVAGFEMGWIEDLYSCGALDPPPLPDSG